jgi:hypothetical protein
MSEYLAEPVTSAATIATINASKLGTVGGAVVATSASFFGEYGIAILGLCFTVLFGLLGLIVTYHFKNKEHALKVKEDARRDAEHAATMARLTAR